MMMVLEVYASCKGCEMFALSAQQPISNDVDDDFGIAERGSAKVATVSFAEIKRGGGANFINRLVSPNGGPSQGVKSENVKYEVCFRGG